MIAPRCFPLHLCTVRLVTVARHVVPVPVWVRAQLLAHHPPHRAVQALRAAAGGWAGGSGGRWREQEGVRASAAAGIDSIVPSGVPGRSRQSGMSSAQTAALHPSCLHACKRAWNGGRSATPSHAPTAHAHPYSWSARDLNWQAPSPSTCRSVSPNCCSLWSSSLHGRRSGRGVC